MGWWISQELTPYFCWFTNQAVYCSQRVIDGCCGGQAVRACMNMLGQALCLVLSQLCHALLCGHW